MQAHHEPAERTAHAAQAPGRPAKRGGPGQQVAGGEQRAARPSAQVRCTSACVDLELTQQRTGQSFPLTQLQSQIWSASCGQAPDGEQELRAHDCRLHCPSQPVLLTAWLPHTALTGCRCTDARTVLQHEPHMSSPTPRPCSGLILLLRRRCMESMAALKHEGAMWRERALYVVRSNSQLVRQQMVCLPACPAVRSNSQLVRQQMVCLPALLCDAIWCLSLWSQHGCSLKHTPRDSVGKCG